VSRNHQFCLTRLLLDFFTLNRIMLPACGS
jgi:hypothetical protein